MDQGTINFIYIGVILLILIIGVVKFRAFEKGLSWLKIGTSNQTLTKERDKYKRHLDAARMDELKLIDELNLYRAMEGVMKIGFWDWNLAPDTDILNNSIPRDNVKSSPNFKKIFDVEGREVTGADLINVILEDHRAEVEKILEDVFFNNRPNYTMEYPIGHRNGHVYWIRCWGVVMGYDKEKKPTRIRGAIQIIDK